MGETKPVGDVAQDRLQEYAEAYRGWKNGGGVKPEHVEDLECRLIQDLTANAAHAEVERRACALYQQADSLRLQVEELMDALARATATTAEVPAS